LISLRKLIIITFIILVLSTTVGLGINNYDNPKEMIINRIILTTFGENFEFWIPYLTICLICGYGFLSYINLIEKKSDDWNEIKILDKIFYSGFCGILINFFSILWTSAFILPIIIFDWRIFELTEKSIFLIFSIICISYTTIIIDLFKKSKGRLNEIKDFLIFSSKILPFSSYIMLSVGLMCMNFSDTSLNIRQKLIFLIIYFGGSYLVYKIAKKGKKYGKSSRKQK